MIMAESSCCSSSSSPFNHPASSSMNPLPKRGGSDGGGGGNSLQQLLCLLCDIISTIAFSIFYSCILAVRSIVSQRFPLPDSTTAGKLGAISLYEGKVWHERVRPIPHKFEYNVRYALVQLDCAPRWFKSRAALHHMNANQARNFAGTTGPVYLLTVPTSVGYEQNPLSIYYCFNDDESCLVCCIAEVTNTPWAERVTFLFDAKADLVAKPLHVSPFMDMLGTWKMKASLPARDLSITIVVQHPELGNYFTAFLSAKRVDYTLTNREGFFWLAPHKVAIGIYWQALLLWWKGVKFHQHPKYIDGDVYRDRAIQCDQELSSPPAQKWQESTLSKDSGANCPWSQTSSAIEGRKLRNERLYTWGEAQWPWR